MQEKVYLSHHPTTDSSDSHDAQKSHLGKERYFIQYIGQELVFFMNPWVVRVENRTTLYINNMHFPKVQHTFTLEHGKRKVLIVIEFVQNIDLCHGKIQLHPASDHFIYRQQFFAFLVFSPREDKLLI